MTMKHEGLDVIWQPGNQRLENCQLKLYMDWLAARNGLHFDDFESLWQWSVDNLEDFWESIWVYFEVPHSQTYARILDTHEMPGAQWFEGAKLNIAERMLQFNHGDDAVKPAVISRSEVRGPHELSWGEYRAQVASVAHALRGMGVEKGDRVVAYMPNITEAVIAFTACASIGAIWSICSPDMGPRSVLDRFKQIAPKVMFAADGYRYNGKNHDKCKVVDELRDGLPTLEHLILLPYLDGSSRLKNSHDFNELTAARADIEFEQVEFDHPLWILYSSGTTGLPKPIVHGHGGVLLETLKNISLQIDIAPDDRFMWFTTTGWMMWNVQVGALMVGATACLYDGSPGYPDLSILWQFADQADMKLLGASAAYFDACRKAGLEPKRIADTRSLQAIGSTGSPLSPETFHWIADHAGEDIWVASSSGGTDVVTAFVGGCPIKPVIAGEIQARGLGVAAYAFDEAGGRLNNEVGELVITKPMPSMPLCFWGDDDGSRLRSSYFETYPGYWRHGDWVRITPRGGVVIYGRSDTTINRRGVRMGTGEIYRVVENFDEIVDSLVIDLEYLGRQPRMLLFVALRPAAEWTEALAERINSSIREQLSPRHVPSEIIRVDEVPRTLSGKKMELPIKKLFLGMPLGNVVNRDAMANPDSLQYYTKLANRYIEQS